MDDMKSTKPRNEMRRLRQIITAMLVLLVVFSSPRVSAQQDDLAPPPNLVVIFTDDQGYADVGTFGAEQDFETPNLDRMAAQGVRFTNWYVSQAVCSASRASLLTGCYNVRIGILGALAPSARHGLHENEATLAELCKQKNYATAVFGKWHLGHHRKFLPLQHGFDEYFGLPYSNDMWPYHPGVMHLSEAKRKKRWPDLPLIKNNEIIDAEVTPDDQAMLTTWYTEHAVDFINRHRDEPFFLYVAHSMPHVPLYVSDKFKGKSKQGLYGDVIMEIDWSVGEIFSALKNNGLDDRTLVIFTSDNGPWLNYGDHAGSARPLREGKGTMFDGGCRTPCIMRWPGKIPAGSTCDQLAATIDVLPTAARLIGVDLPEHKIDGKDIWPLMSGQPGAQSPHEVYYMYYGGELQAVRSGRWKLHFPHQYRTLAGKPGGSGGKPANYSQAHVGLELFDLDNDIGETTNVAHQHPDIVKRLQQYADEARRELGDSAVKQKGVGVRPAGQLAPDS